MTDAGLVEKKLRRVEICLADLTTVDVDRISTDRREERFAEHTLQIAVQAIIDVAAHIVADDALGDPSSNHALFELLGRAGWIDPADVPTLKRMVGFRNLLVHEYDTVDVGVVADVVSTRTGDLQRFVDAIRARLSRGSRAPS